MPAPGSLRIASPGGIPLRLHWTALFLVPLLASGIHLQAPALAAAARLDPSALALPGWGFGLVAVALLLASVALHELGHALLARGYGGAVDGILLFGLGGVTQMTAMPKRPRHELLVALAGPAVSLLVAAAAWLGFSLAASAGLPSVAFACALLGAMNAMLAVFNLAPAFPMDGGRALRAVLASWLGEPRATRIVVAVARGMAFGFALLGLFGGGFMLILVGAFVWIGAGQEGERVKAAAALRGVRIGELATFAPSVPAASTLEDARLALLHAGAEVAVVEEGGETVGVIRREDCLAVPLADRLQHTVSEAMRRVATIPADAELGGTFDRVLRDGHAPVGDGRHVVSADDVLRTLFLRGHKVPYDPRRGTPRA